MYKKFPYALFLLHGRFLSQILKFLAAGLEKGVEKIMIYHCFFSHIDLCDWNVLPMNNFFTFTCKMGALLFSPLVGVIIRSSGEGFSVLVTQEASVFLPALPARAAASAWFPWAPYQQLVLRFHSAANSLLFLRALAEEAAQWRCAHVSVCPQLALGAPLLAARATGSQRLPAQLLSFPWRPSSSGTPQWASCLHC